VKRARSGAASDTNGLAALPSAESSAAVAAAIEDSTVYTVPAPMDVPERTLPSRLTKSRGAGNHTSLASAAWKIRLGPSCAK